MMRSLRSVSRGEGKAADGDSSSRGGGSGNERSIEEYEAWFLLGKQLSI